MGALKLTRRKLLWSAIAVCFSAKQSSAQSSFPKPMPDSEFWSLIALVTGSKRFDDDTDFEPLIAALVERGAESILSFYETLGRKAAALATRDHYSAFAPVDGLADSFLYTRLMVITWGEAAYDRILSNPSAFPARSTDWIETLLYVADDAHLRATGREIDREISAPLW